MHQRKTVLKLLKTVPAGSSETFYFEEIFFSKAYLAKTQFFILEGEPSTTDLTVKKGIREIEQLLVEDIEQDLWYEVKEGDKISCEIDNTTGATEVKALVKITVEEIIDLQPSQIINQMVNG